MTTDSSRSEHILLTFLLLYSIAVGSRMDNCDSTNHQPYLYYGSHTAYEIARNPQGIPTVPECKPLQLWMVGRHGARWKSPTESFKFINLQDLRDHVLANHQLGRGTLCTADLNGLRAWRQFLVSTEERVGLTPQGKRDIQEFGTRIKNTFWELVENRNSSSDFVFRHTEMQRTRETAEYFAKGLFGHNFEPDFPEPVEDDRLLEAWDNCPAWRDKNERVQEKIDQFSKGTLMQEVYQNVSSRLGFNYNLPYYVLEAVYNSCSYERAWSVESVPAWCCAFTRSELEVLEYLDDLRYFYRTGHGDHADMNNRLGCPLVRDMMSNFMAIEDGMNPRPAGVFYFTEAETVGLVATRLELLEHHQRLTDSPTRHYRTSALLPFGGNIIAAFYQCSSGEKYRVMFMVSEHVVAYPGCPAGLCPWSLIKRKFSRIIHSASCSDDFCFHNPHFWSRLSAIELWAIIAFASAVLFVIHLMRAVNKLTE